MTIIDHLSVGVASIAQATAFYDRALAPLGVRRLAASEGFAAYGREAVKFLAMTPADGRPYTAGNGVHIAFAAPSQDAVRAFHAAAIEAGGRDEGAPGPRPAYPKPGVFAAFVRDPFGNKLEVIHNGFST